MPGGLGRTGAGVPTQELSPGLAVELRLDLVRPRLTVAGELDLSSAGLLSAMLDHVRRTQGRGRAADHVDVDLAEVVFADTHGLAPVLDGRTRIVAASGPVRRLLRLLADEPEPVRGTA